MTDVELVNTALLRLGQPVITALTESSARAKAASALYPSVRDGVLTEGRWNEAITRSALAKLVAPPAWGFSNAFQLPSDFLRLQYPEDIDFDYRIEGDQILSELTGMNITYVRRITDVNQMSFTLQDAMSKRLSAELAIPLTGSDGKQDRMWRLYKDAIATALFADAQQAPIDQIAGSRWLNSRYGDQQIYRPISSTST